MEESYDACWMCFSLLKGPGIAYYIPEVSERHNVVLCDLCYAHPKRDQILLLQGADPPSPWRLTPRRGR